MDSADQQRTRFRYDLSVFQLEYSRNLLFNRGQELEQFFQGLIDRTRATLDIKTIKTILGCKQRPQKRSKTRWEITVETPEYGLTIFKVHAGALTLKIYTKGERVLRCEIMLHNARKLKLGTLLERWPHLLAHLQGVLERFLAVVHCADTAAIDDGSWDALPQPGQVGGRRVAGVQVTSERLGAVMTAVVALATQPGGFTSGELATRSPGAIALLARSVSTSAGGLRSEEAARQRAGGQRPRQAALPILAGGSTHAGGRRLTA